MLCEGPDREDLATVIFCGEWLLHTRQMTGDCPAVKNEIQERFCYWRKCEVPVDGNKQISFYRSYSFDDYCFERAHGYFTLHGKHR